jgi:hypothetical protein
MEEDLRQAEEENIQRAIEEKNRREAEDYDKATNPSEVDPLAPKEFEDSVGNIWPSFEVYQKHWDKVDPAMKTTAWEGEVATIGAAALAATRPGLALEVLGAAGGMDINEFSFEQLSRYLTTGGKFEGIKEVAKAVAPETYSNIIEWTQNASNSLFKRNNPNWRVSPGTVGAQKSPLLRWENFGYRRGKKPTVVNRLKDDPTLQKVVDDSLYDFFERADRYTSSGKQLGNYPMYWENPATGDVYKAALKYDIFGKPQRYTLKSMNRYLREVQTSSIIEKSNLKYLKKTQITDANKKFRAEYNAKKTELINELNNLDLDLEHLTRRLGGGGKDGSWRNATIESAISQRRRIAAQLENLLDGRYYGEHGYNLANERVQDIVKTNPTAFQLGDAANFHPVFEATNLPDSKSFKVVKDLFEQVINKKVNGQFEFPDLVVNYNPKLEKQGANFIIRLENKDSIRVGRHYKGILSGTAEFKFNYSNLGDTIKSTDDVRNWLRQEGVIKIDPNPPLKESPATKFTPGSTEPVETVEETMNRIMKDR